MMTEIEDDDELFFASAGTNERTCGHQQSYMLYSYFHVPPCFDANLLCLFSSNPTMPDWIVVFSSHRNCGLLLTW